MSIIFRDSHLRGNLRHPRILLGAAFGLLLLSLAPPAVAQPERESQVGSRSLPAARAGAPGRTSTPSRGTATRSTPSRGSSTHGTASRGSATRSGSSRPERATRGGSSGPRHESSAWTRHGSSSRGPSAHHDRGGHGDHHSGYRGSSHRHSYPSYRYGYRYPSYRYGYRYPSYRYRYPRYSVHFGLGYYFPYVSYHHSYHHHYPYYYPRHYRVEVYPQGAFDLDVRPKDTQVYLDGYYIGTAGQFDGWPRYLWLEEDHYELIFYKEGYETVVREVGVRNDDVTRIKFRMQPGPSTPPEALTRYDEERRDAKRSSREPAYGERPATESYAWGGGSEEDERDLRAEPGRLRLEVVPPNASVYLDGEFIGIGAELAALSSGLLIEPGEHRIEIFHPSYESVSRTVELEPGKETRLGIRLE